MYLKLKAILLFSLLANLAVAGDLNPVCEKTLLPGVDDARAYAMPNTSIESSPADRAVIDLALAAFNEKKISYLIGGSVALQRYTGLGRRSQEFELYVHPKDLALVRSSLAQLNFEFQETSGAVRATSGGQTLKIVTASEGGQVQVDDSWFENAKDSMISPEDLIWFKAFTMRRDLLDWHDIGYLLHELSAQLNWTRLLQHFESNWELLLIQLKLFRYAYPSQAQKIPKWVLEALEKREPSKDSARSQIPTGFYASRALDLETDVGPARRVIYVDFLKALNQNAVRYFVGGTFALSHYTGFGKSTKDFDVFIAEKDLEKAFKVLKENGFETELPFSHWLGKAKKGGYFVDLIFSLSNKVSDVNESWAEHAGRGNVFGVPTQFMPIEEMILAKSYIMDRERFDGHDVGLLIHALMDRIDWRRLVQIFGSDWEVLDIQLSLFRYMYPEQAQQIPAWILAEFKSRAQAKYEMPSTALDKNSYGTRLSRGQFLGPMSKWGYTDSRLAPLGGMTSQQIKSWTEAIKTIK